MRMATGGGAPPPAPECCMCGDYGLPQELFKCENCLFRSQHRYCSDMYPKAEIYRYCNWCLKEEKKVMKEALSSTSSNSYNTKTTNSSGASVKLQRGEFPANLSNPVKKQRSPERPAQTKTASSRRARCDDISKGQKTRPVLRSGKVRRYKLLEEVSS